MLLGRASHRTRRLGCTYGLLAALGGLAFPTLGMAATAGCPAPPPLVAKSYDAAASELRDKKSIFVPRRQPQRSARPINTILEAPKVSLEKGVCYLNFAVSDGSLAKTAMTTVNKTAVAGGKVGTGTADGPAASSATKPGTAPAPNPPPAATAPPAQPEPTRPDRGKIIGDILGQILKPRPQGDAAQPPPPEPTSRCPGLPKFSPQTFDAANAAFKQHGLNVRVNRQDVASQSPPGTLLQPPRQVRGKDGVCTVTLVTSDGSLMPVPQACPQIPKFSPSTFDAATAAFNQQKLNVRVDRVNVASSSPRGTLLREPTQTRGPDGVCTVRLVASDGSLARVPSIVGMPRTQAQNTVEAAGLTFKSTESVSKATPGTVVAQDPQAGVEVPRESIVGITVAREPLLEVPQVVGLQSDVARQRLSRFKVQQVVDESVRPAGEIVGQQPSAGERKPPGTPVQITASDGSLVEVPTVAGQNVSDATGQLESAGLTFSKSPRDDAAAPDTVLEQDPAGKAVVKRGHSVSLAVSQGLVVPNVVDMQLDAARTALGQFKVEHLAAESAAPADRVLTQSPAPGTRVGGRTVVNLRVSDGSLVPVPDVRNMTLEAARSALSAAGLVARLTSGPDETDALVTEQTPLPSQGLVKRDSEVGLQAKAQFPWWLAIVLGSVAAGAGIAAYVLRKLRTPKTRDPTPRPITVDATVELSPVPPQVDGAELSGPAFRIEARLLPGRTTIEVDEREHA